MTTELTHTHAWSRWIRGRRTGLWFRHCLSCAARELSETQPPDQVRPRGMPDTFSDAIGYSEDVIYIRRRMEKFTTAGARQAWRVVRQAGSE